LYLVLNHGHVGPVRFITSVEVPKNQSSSLISPNQAVDNLNKETTNSLYKTIVVSGGEGYEEYKFTSNASSGTTLGNSTSNSNIGMSINQQTNIADIQAGSIGSNLANNGNISNSPVSMSSMPNMFPNSFPSSNADEASSLGKDDLINYVVTWEI
jgi:hypothetical protein